jgi:type I restriction enzyme R subunit
MWEVMPMSPTEDDLERWVLKMLDELGWRHAYGPDIAPDEPAAERADWRETILAGRLTHAVARLNPELPPDAVADTVSTVRRAESPVVESENWRAYRLLTGGVPVEYHDADGAARTARALLVDWDDLGGLFTRRRQLASIVV